MANAQFHLHHYPQQEILADHLLKELQEEGHGSPFHQSHVLVRNQGMATWLKRRMALNSGIAMQANFPQPNRFLQDVLGNQSIDPEHLKWEIYQCLPGMLGRKNFELIASYLDSSTDPTETALKRYQLSGIIAGLFDKYLLYRPEWITSWQKNERPRYLPTTAHEPWQRELWQALEKNQGPGSAPHWSQMLLNHAPLELPDDKVKSLHVFGISNFAPIYVQFLYRLSEQIPVHIYWMNPVEAHEGYWEDAPSRQQWTMAKAFDDPETLQHHNPLLASFGRLGREFVHTLYGGNRADYHIQETDSHFPSPVIEHPQTRLEHLQSSLYNNQPSKEKSHSGDRDNSISIHSCHTPLRELETLKNYLLTLAEDSPLDTSDVLVMCPDINSYAPAIEAVFGGDESPTLSFTIGDSHSPDNDPTIAAVLQLFSMHTLRFTNHEALSLLSTPAIRNHFELSEDDLGTLRDWIIRNGIRWGFDRHHAQEIAPNCPESPWTWRDGVHRMLLGYAMPNPETDGKAPTLWQGVLPFHDIEGSHSRLLGALCQFLDWCKKIRNDISQTRRLSEWVDLTRQWIDLGFNKDSDSQQQLQPLYQVLDVIIKQSTTADEELPVEVFREHLNNQLRDTNSPRGFLSGAITFCEMKPMRAIPSRVICLLGMNHDTFPRQNTEVQFDLTQLDRAKGDRSTRDDDTYSFLEALLSARESLFISYIGTSIKDGKERPPSTALQTLLDYEPSLASCRHQEKLHAFDPHYFDAEKPISHSVTLRDAALLLSKNNQEPQSKPKLSIPDVPEQKTIDLNRWISAITTPARHFLKNCLQARTVYKDSPLVENEAIELDTLDRYQMRQLILNNRNLPPEQIQAWQQKGSIPVGGLGRKAITDHFTEIVDQLPNIPEFETMEIAIPIDDVTITGNVPMGEIDGEKMIIVLDASSGKAGTQLKTWIYQLLASAQLKTPVPGCLFYVDKNRLKTKNWAATENYAVHLTELMDIYHQCQQHPVPHFAQTALAYLGRQAKKNEPESEHEQNKKSAALAKWESSDRHTGESEDEATQYLFATTDLFTNQEFTNEFLSISARIWNPVLAQQD